MYATCLYHDINFAFSAAVRNIVALNNEIHLFAAQELRHKKAVINTAFCLYCCYAVVVVPLVVPSVVVEPVFAVVVRLVRSLNLLSYTVTTTSLSNISRRSS